MADKVGRIDQVVNNMKNAMKNGMVKGTGEFRDLQLAEISLTLAMIADLIVEKMIREEGSEPDVRG